MRERTGPGWRGRGRGHGQGRGRRRRGGLYLLEPVLLLSVRHGGTHGYSLLEELEEFGLNSLDPSIVYRILRQMELDGWVTSVWDKEQSQGPPRRVYRLSQLGEEVLRDWIEELKKVDKRITRLLKASELNPKKGGNSDA